MIVLSGAELVLPDRILSPGTLVIDADRVVDIRPGGGAALHGHYIVPGFIDVHVHGVDGIDSLDQPSDGDPIATLAAALPRYGVTGFCPTTVACGPRALGRIIGEVRRARASPATRSARVLPLHLESNFINPAYCGAQPTACLRLPRDAFAPASRDARSGGDPDRDFSAVDILAEIERAGPDVGIVTLAPELDGAIELIRWLRAHGHQPSLGHSAATYESALDAIAAGARQATHLFNRMPAFGHRSPGLVGAILQTDEVAAEIICDGVHVHPAAVRTAIAAKRPPRVMAITDATAVAGLAEGASALLGGRAITSRGSAAYLSDGTLAGSVLTMDRAFRNLAGGMGLPLVDVAMMCSTTPARELGLVGHGVIAVDAIADLVVLDAQFSVVQTYVGGQLAYARNTGAGISV